MWVYLSQGRTDIYFKWYTLATVVFIISFIVGLRAGVEGVAIAYTIAMYLLAYPNFAIPFKLIDLRVRDYFASIKTIMFATLVIGIIALAVRVFLEGLGGVPNVIILTIVTAISLLSYLGLIFLLERSLFTETLQLISEARYSPADITENQD
jgi:PST family polysaccharide transporter